MPRPDTPERPRRKRGFQRTATLVAPRVRAAGETRGFAVAKLLTHWPEVVGKDIAAVCRPVEVSYGRGAFGGTLTLLTTGAQAPMLEMQAETIRERVNVCYGYAAISRVRITQTAATGFAEGRADFDHGPRPAELPPEPSPATGDAARAVAQDVTDPGLRAALEKLGQLVLTATETKPKKG